MVAWLTVLLCVVLIVLLCVVIFLISPLTFLFIVIVRDKSVKEENKIYIANYMFPKEEDMVKINNDWVKINSIFKGKVYYRKDGIIHNSDLSNIQALKRII